MWEHVTVENVALMLSLGLFIDRVLRRVAQTTGWRGDDRLVEEIDRAKAWVARFAPLLWGIIEDASKTGAFPKAEKARRYGERLAEEWRKSNPRLPMPAEAAAEATLVAQGLSALSKAPSDPR